MKRQVFLCSLGGFDTHGSQAWQHWSLLRQVADGLAAFYNATIEMGVADRVTSFTLSDFGRSLQPSGSGSDHGWGNHHVILGGAVQGGQIYGAFPSMSLGGPDDSGNRGALIPSTSTEQYGATLATWLGVPEANLPSVFPNISNFAAANLDPKLIRSSPFIWMRTQKNLYNFARAQRQHFYVECLQYQ